MGETFKLDIEVVFPNQSITVFKEDCPLRFYWLLFFNAEGYSTV